jgi:hypothetical protein
MYLYIQPKTVKLVEDNKGISSLKLGLAMKFFVITSKSLAIKAKEVR